MNKLLVAALLFGALNYSNVAKASDIIKKGSFLQSDLMRELKHLEGSAVLRMRTTDNPEPWTYAWFPEMKLCLFMAERLNAFFSNSIAYCDERDR